MVKNNDKWLSDYKIYSLPWVTFEVGVTIKDSNGSPDVDGVKTAEEFVNFFPSYWGEIFSRIIDFNSDADSSNNRNLITLRASPLAAP